ncbi:MAG: bifunctional phosphoribosyl-AMP cyclohydrolase/phosphoribosyl-ATP diphosphatase HisIE [Bacillota bacterium]|jgi:phosphoribosyl-ATP pyrophosphohydrolase/phosphoribosyl-AMP cyclohydrolase
MIEQSESPDSAGLKDWIDTLKFDDDGLIPAVVQDADSLQVLMVAHMNRESIKKTIREGRTCFWSRSRKALWVKGETSGHFQDVRAVYCDCDRDCLLIQVDQTGAACHTGQKSCFFTRLSSRPRCAAGVAARFSLNELYRIIQDRKAGKPEGSYTAKLLSSGQDRVLKKVAEEAGEVMLASRNNDNDEIIREMADLWFHSLLVLAYHDIPPQAVVDELARRHAARSAQPAGETSSSGGDSTGRISSLRP